jgi:hypothetical protein
MQLCRIIYYFLAALHVSSDIFAHHQEHINCITASGITHVCRCQLPAVSSDIFAHHQEHLNCITASGITHVCRCQLPAVSSDVLADPEHLNCITASGITHVCRCELAATYVCNTRSCNTV